jgi:hypothetical protein
MPRVMLRYNPVSSDMLNQGPIQAVSCSQHGKTDTTVIKITN